MWPVRGQERHIRGKHPVKEQTVFHSEASKCTLTSRSIMSLGKGTSGLSPMSSIGMQAFLISFSTNPVKRRQRRFFQGTRESSCFALDTELSLRLGERGRSTYRLTLAWPVSRHILSSLTQLAIHLLASSYFVDKLSLEHIHVRI